MKLWIVLILNVILYSFNFYFFKNTIVEKDQKHKQTFVNMRDEIQKAKKLFNNAETKMKNLQNLINNTKSKLGKTQSLLRNAEVNLNNINNEIKIFKRNMDIRKNEFNQELEYMRNIDDLIRHVEMNMHNVNEQINSLDAKLKRLELSKYLSFDDTKHNKITEEPDIKYVKSRMSADGMIILLLANYEFRMMALNWLCHFKRFNLSNYVFVSVDKQMHEWLLSKNGLLANLLILINRTECVIEKRFFQT